MTPEKRVQNAIDSYLTELTNNGAPIKHFRRQAGGFSYKEGLPDLYATINGRHVEIEVKRPGGEMSSQQEKWQKFFRSIGTLCICVDSLDDFKAFLECEFGIKS